MKEVRGCDDWRNSCFTLSRVWWAWERWWNGVYVQDSIVRDTIMSSVHVCVSGIFNDCLIIFVFMIFLQPRSHAQSFSAGTPFSKLVQWDSPELQCRIGLFLHPHFLKISFHHWKALCWNIFVPSSNKILLGGWDGGWGSQAFPLSGDLPDNPSLRLQLDAASSGIIRLRRSTRRSRYLRVDPNRPTRTTRTVRCNYA